MKNAKVRRAMFDAQVTQAQLAEHMGVGLPEVNVMLKYELAGAEQNLLVERVRKIAKERENDRA